MRNREDCPEKARNYAFLLLKFRLRSERELTQRLKQKSFKEPAIKETISFLKEKGFINDDAFARMWLASRLKRPLGLRRIRQELKAKGVDEEIIESQVREIKKDYSEEEIIKKLVKTRLDKSKRLDPRIARRRVMGYLLRRGFPPETVADVMNQF
ncbi:MAG: regulatory protein RecX [Candidatus Omnitrophota bacterium]